MAPRLLFVPFIGAILLSCTTARPIEAPASPLATRSRGVGGEGIQGGVPPGRVAVARDGAIWLVREGGTAVEHWPVGGTEGRRIAVDPVVVWSALRPAADGSVVAISSRGSVVRSVVHDPKGTTRDLGPALDVAGEERLERRGDSLVFVAATGETVVPLPEGIGRIEGRLLAPGGRAVLRVQGEKGDSLLLVSAAGVSVRPIAGPFEAIHSFDVSPDGTEAVFSARRASGFDIGLVATEGGDVRWIGPDPLDEVMVRWAPRGNKFAYVIETPNGSLVRSVHVVTGFQISVPLPFTVVRDLAWDPEAERLALLVTSADASERVETMRFDGTERRTAVPPEARSREPEPLAGIPGGVVFAPDAIRYNQKLPLVIWESPRGFAFLPWRARLEQNRAVGSVVVSRGTTARPEFWRAVADLSWADPERVFIVADTFGGAAAIPDGTRPTVLTVAAAGSSERVTVVRTSGSESLEEFAVRWLGERLREVEREHDGN